MPQQQHNQTSSEEHAERAPHRQSASKSVIEGLSNTVTRNDSQHR